MEFVEVMKQWKRMCAVMDVCEDCPFFKVSCWAGHPDGLAGDFKAREEIIMRWAAEHPEPVYPTWVEYLVGIGIIPHEIRLETADALMDTHLLKPIPADIAQKLGIEPKEV